MKLLICFAFAFCLTGCATEYQRMGLSGGYQEMKLADNVYSVEYYSNTFTGHSQNEHHALRRAAELSIEKGYRYFIVSNSRDLSSAYTTPVIANTTVNTTNNTYGSYGYRHYNAYSNGYGNASTVVSGGNTMVRPGVQLIVIMSNKKNDRSFDANAILSNYVVEPSTPKDKLKRILG